MSLLVVGRLSTSGADQLRSQNRRDRDELTSGMGTIAVDVERAQADSRRPMQAACEADELLDARLIGVEPVGCHVPQLYSGCANVRQITLANA